MQEEFFLFVF